MALVKAKIINLDKSGDDLTVLFNPKEFSIQKTVQWEPHKAPGLNLPEQEFTSGNPRVLSVELFFDTYEEKKSVHEYTDKLQNYALVDPTSTSRRWCCSSGARSSSRAWWRPSTCASPCSSPTAPPAGPWPPSA